MAYHLKVTGTRIFFRRDGDAGGTAAAILNAANEVAVAAFLDEQWRQAGAALERLAAKAGAGQSRIHAVMKRGVPWRAIVTTARRTRADLIVLATHGRTGLAHIMMGSVTFIYISFKNFEITGF